MWPKPCQCFTVPTLHKYPDFVFLVEVESIKFTSIGVEELKCSFLNHCTILITVNRTALGLGGMCFWSWVTPWTDRAPDCLALCHCCPGFLIYIVLKIGGSSGPETCTLSWYCCSKKLFKHLVKRRKCVPHFQARKCPIMGNPAPTGTAQIRWKNKIKRGLTLSTFLKGRGVCSASFLLALIINIDRNALQEHVEGKVSRVGGEAPRPLGVGVGAVGSGEWEGFSFYLKELAFLSNSRASFSHDIV